MTKPVGIFLVILGYIFSYFWRQSTTCWRQVTDLSATSPRGSYGEVADKSCRVVSWRRI